MDLLCYGKNIFNFHFNRLFSKLIMKFTEDEWSGILGILLAILFTIYILSTEWDSPWDYMK